MRREKERFALAERKDEKQEGDLDGGMLRGCIPLLFPVDAFEKFPSGVRDAAETISERDRNGLSIVHSEDLWQKSLAAHKSARVFELCANVKRECGLTRDYFLFLFFFFFLFQCDFR